MNVRRPLRIANISGFYGDRLDAANEIIAKTDVDVLSGDWLAELTMGILIRDRMRDDSLGYARTFLPLLKEILATCLERQIRIVSNAGGTHPEALAQAIGQLAKTLHLPRPLRIAVLKGDDISERIPSLTAQGLLPHMRENRCLTPADGTPLAAHAYLGAAGIRQALLHNADLVITGRTTDAALVVGPAAWWHDWQLGHADSLDALAGALVAGHVIECGAQATGGNFTRFELFDDTLPGFPIAEIAADGSAVITKAQPSGGLVSVDTVKAQLLYEIQGPRYVSPDVVARLDTVVLAAQGPDRVLIHQTRGEPPPDTLKVGTLLMAGYRNQVDFLLGGARLDQKVERISSQLFRALGGKAQFGDTHMHLIRGDHAHLPPVDRISQLTLAFSDASAQRVGKRLGQAAVALALSSVPGMTLASLPKEASPVVVFWPSLLPRNTIAMHLDIDGQHLVVEHPPIPERNHAIPLPSCPTLVPSDHTVTLPLAAIASARSGDKAGDANIGFWCHDNRDWPALMLAITPHNLRQWLGGWQGDIYLHPLPNLAAIHVLLPGWLGRGVAANLALDPQGKCLAESLLTAKVTFDLAYLQSMA